MPQPPVASIESGKARTPIFAVHAHCQRGDAWTWPAAGASDARYGVPLPAVGSANRFSRSSRMSTS